MIIIEPGIAYYETIFWNVLIRLEQNILQRNLRDLTGNDSTFVEKFMHTGIVHIVTGEILGVVYKEVSQTPNFIYSLTCFNHEVIILLGVENFMFINLKKILRIFPQFRVFIVLMTSCAAAPEIGKN